MDRHRERVADHTENGVYVEMLAPHRIAVEESVIGD